MFSYHHNLLPISFHSYCVKPTHTYSTRFSKSNFSLPALSQKVSEKSIKIIGPKVWSSISNDLKSIQFRKNFSKHLKQSFIAELPEYTGVYKPKFLRKKQLSTTLQDIFDAEDDDETFLGFSISLSKIFEMEDENDETFLGFSTSNRN